MIRINMDNAVKIFAASSLTVTKCYVRKCFPLLSQRCYGTNPRDDKTKKNPHPYRKIHPWRSLKAFTNSLIAGVIHNEDGLVAINKPYGISGKSLKSDSVRPTGIVDDVNYTISDAIPEMAKTFGHLDLKLIKCPEKFTSGIAMLAADVKAEHRIEKALLRATAMRILVRTYWAVTTRLPNQTQGEMRLGMKMQPGPGGKNKKPIIITDWSHNMEKRREMKILNVQFQVMSNSSENLSSLVQIRTSTAKWHALRLFAATVLYSPILGDNLYGSRVKKVMGAWVNVSPFVDAANEPPVLDTELLTKLKLSKGKEALIPTHLHLREILLPMFNNKESDVVLTAPLMPEFAWTCQRLEFKHDLFEVEKKEEFCVDDLSDNADRYQAVT